MTQYIIPRGTLVQPVLYDALESGNSVELNRNLVLSETNCVAYFEAKLNETIFGFYAFNDTLGGYMGFWYFVADVTAEKL